MNSCSLTTLLNRSDIYYVLPYSFFSSWFFYVTDVNMQIDSPFGARFAYIVATLLWLRICICHHNVAHSTEVSLCPNLK